MELKVDFVGIGSGKCGSTWLWENLVKHPQIFDGNLKELNYFSDLCESQPLSWYASQFAGCPPGLIRGEFSVTYISHPKAAERIRSVLPDVRLIAIVRNPVKRAFSNYLHSIRKGDIPAKLSFDRYIEDERRLAPGCYVDHLEPFFALFDPEQILVLVAEEFLRDPLAGYRRLFRHVGVDDPEFVPPGFDERRNVARSYRFLRLENLLFRTYRGLSRRGYNKLVKRVIESGITERIRSLNSDQRPIPQIDESSRNRLSDYYYPFNRRLENLLGQDLSSWETREGSA